MTRQFMHHCPKCGTKTMHIGNSTSHVLHFLLSLVTFGGWLIVWAFVALSNRLSGACTQCGKKRAFG